MKERASERARKGVALAATNRTTGGEGEWGRRERGSEKEIETATGREGGKLSDFMHLAFPYSQGFGISGVSISALKLLKWSKEVRQVGERAQKMSITANFCQREMLLDDLKLKIISMNSPVSRLVRSETVSDIQRQDVSESRIDLRKPSTYFLRNPNSSMIIFTSRAQRIFFSNHS